MTREQHIRLYELAQLDADNVPLSPEDYAEYNMLLTLEDAAFVLERVQEINGITTWRARD